MDHSIRRINHHTATAQPRHMSANIQLHTYEVTTVPVNVRPEDVDMLAEAKRLPRTRIKSVSADAARKTAMHVLRDRVHDVYRVGEVAA